MHDAEVTRTICAGDSCLVNGRWVASLDQTATTLLWLGAVRYHLGRHTYAVGEIAEELLSHWPTLPLATRELIQRDIEREFVRDDNFRADAKARGVPQPQWLPLGADYDRAQWQRVRALWGR